MHPGTSHGLQSPPSSVLPARADSGRDSMSSITINKSLFLKGQSSFAGFTEIVGAVRSVKSQRALNYVSAEVIDLARHAWLSRGMEICRAASTLVLALDVSPSLRTVAEYYKSLSEPERVADPVANRTSLIRTADECGEEYLPRIILLVGNSYHREENYGEALRYYIEAAKAARDQDVLSRAQSVWNIAVLESDCGDSAGALRRFESICPIVGALCHWYPALYAKYLNNLAALLAENRRVGESRQAIEVALASPFAHRFPEWRETQREIEEAAKQEQRKRAPTGQVLAPARPARPAKKLPKPPRVFVATIVDPVRISNLLSFRHSSPHVVSLLERYVKTVRIRDRP
jgi:tetratricopeptide (TPR) repeat protein